MLYIAAGGFAAAGKPEPEMHDAWRDHGLALGRAW